jgi:diguanylate cyclase (GGDEF)-like protein
MPNYISRSFEKFRQDALSKLFYDILKWLIPATVLFAVSKVVPEDTSIGQLISKTFSITVYFFLLIVLLIIVLTVIIVSFLFNKHYKVLQKDNYTDELTGLKNHKEIKEYLAVKINDSKRLSKTFSLIIVDVDDFKNLNTKFTPNIADKLLTKLGELLGNDKRITDETFRQFLRGDEFIVLATDTNLNEAYKAAERKRNLIEKTSFTIEGISHNLTVCCGVTEFKKEDDIRSITDRLNQALVEAKKQVGKNNTKTII